VKVGIAVRLAQDLNLASEPSASLHTAEREDHRRTFWSLYLLERLISCGRCRPPAILDRSCSLRLPCGDIAWLTDTDQEMPTLGEVHSGGSASASAPLTGFANVIVAARTLARCAQYILPVSNSNSNSIGSRQRLFKREDMPWYPQSRHAVLASDLILLESLLDMGKPIEEALDAHYLPDGFLDQRAASSIVFARLLLCLCQCLLYHPFLIGEHIRMASAAAPCSSDDSGLFASHIPHPARAFHSQARRMSTHAAETMLSLLVRSKQAGHVIVTSFSGYCVTVAVTVLGLATAKPSTTTTSLMTPSEGDSARAQAFSAGFTNALEHLEWLARYWSNAGTMVRFLPMLEMTCH